MRHSEVVNHQYISLLPAVKDEVLPDSITDVIEVSLGYLTAITVGSMEADIQTAKESQQNDL